TTDFGSVRRPSWYMSTIICDHKIRYGNVITVFTRLPVVSARRSEAPGCDCRSEVRRSPREIAAAAVTASVEIEAAGSVASAGRHSSLLTQLCPPDSSEPGGHRHLHGCAPQRREDSVFLSTGAAAERRSLVFGELT